MLFFEYQLTGSGWAEATLAAGASQEMVRVSYLSGALRDLTAAVIAWLEGSHSGQCI